MQKSLKNYTTTLEDEELITGEAVSLTVRPASFALRATGAAIDFVAMVLVLTMLAMIASNLAANGVLDSAMLQAVSTAAMAIVMVVVPTTVETMTRGLSLGKLIVGVRIVRDDGGSIQFRHALIRALLGVLEIWITLGGVAAIVGLLNPKTKRLGDILSGTYSQYERVVLKHDREYITVPAELLSWSQLADVGRLPVQLTRRIASFQQQVTGLSPFARQQLSEDLAREVSQYVSPIPVAHPEAILRAVVALRRDRDYKAISTTDSRINQLEPILRARPGGFPDR